MIPATDDVRIAALKQLIAPAVLTDELAIDEAKANLVVAARQAAEKILKGEDDRLLIVVGPCSIHDPAAALDYGRKLKAFADPCVDWETSEQMLTGLAETVRARRNR